MRKPLFYFVIVVVLVGCGRREDVDRIMIINQNLEQTNHGIQEDNEVLQKTLFERGRTPRTIYYGKIWEPRGSRIKKEADSIVAIIEKLKAVLLTQTDSLKKQAPSFIKQLNGTDGPCYKLVQRLASFKVSIPAVFTSDSSLRYEYIQREIHEIYTKAPLMYGYSDSLNKGEQMRFINDWQEKNFSGITSLMALLVLNKIENDVLSTAKMFLDYCLNKTEAHRCVSFRGIAVLNSSYVKQGQPIEVTAGIGDFDSVNSPRIAIDGKEIEVDGDGAAVHRFVAKGRPGKHKIRVDFEYLEPDGTTEHVYKYLNYIIADEK